MKRYKWDVENYEANVKQANVARYFDRASNTSKDKTAIVAQYIVARY